MDEQVLDTPPRRNIKTALLLVITLAIAGVVAYGYLWFGDLREHDAQAVELLSEYERLQQLEQAAQTEYTRCQEFISRQEGDFASFEYCKRFIDWYGSVKSSS